MFPECVSEMTGLYFYLHCHGGAHRVTPQCEKRMIYHVGLSLLSILQRSLVVGLVRGPTYNFMLLKREKRTRDKGRKIDARSGPLQRRRLQRGGAGPERPLQSARGQLT